ncbi:DUF1272 domain-containing protein [Asaia spathodeae]|uniref:DUF1272 domain-containing protein n=1 Tax=Asaia spathodeae TaxID=657016 RepID=A0ABX2P2I8_9PROT|nr:DUF1272 domain-containing protein [Asaia spathodeae]
MLELRPGCECCDRDLPPDTDQAMICSLECTFCLDCTTVRLGGLCPNCGGDLVRRPTRPVRFLGRSSASTQRVFKPLGCACLVKTDFRNDPVGTSIGSR